jgi:hypothetical protein
MSYAGFADHIGAVIHLSVWILALFTALGVLQTWEDPSHVDPRTNAKGDNDPLDVCEIGQRTFARGEVVPVRMHTHTPHWYWPVRPHQHD